MSVQIAVEGCCHGELDAIYTSLKQGTELLLICGDFQAIRNSTDLKTLNVPRKYLRMGDFSKYYLGQKKAPVLTIFIGGNHECLLYLRELQYGGWVAPNIYYLGEFGVVWYKGLRISGMSGIWNYHSFVSALQDPPMYSLPYLYSSIKSIYHVKPKNYLKFLLSGPSDISMSHDWPQWVWKWGDSKRLLRNKPFFKDDMASGKLGSPLASQALNHIKPRYWFSLHLHTRFTAEVKHEIREEKVVEASTGNPEEIELDMDSGEENSDQKNNTAEKDDREINLEQTQTVGESKDTPETHDVLEAPGTFQHNGIKECNSLETSNVLSKSQSTQSLAQSNESSAELKNSHQIDLDMDDDLPLVPQAKKRKTNHANVTKFLALDKCLPRRRYIEFMLIEPQNGTPESKSLFYDARGLAIQKVIEDFVKSNPLALKEVGFDKFINAEKVSALLLELEDSVAYEEKKLAAQDLEIPYNFTIIAPATSEKDIPLRYWENNQTREMCEKFNIPQPDLSGP